MNNNGWSQMITGGKCVHFSCGYQWMMDDWLVVEPMDGDIHIWFIYGQYMDNLWISMDNLWICLVVEPTPLTCMSLSVGMMTFPISMEKQRMFQTTNEIECSG